MQKMVSYDYRKSFYISGHIPGTIRGSKVRYYIKLVIPFTSKIYLLHDIFSGLPGLLNLPSGERKEVRFVSN